MLSTRAHAHAGLPETSSVSVQEGQPAHLFVGASFGAALSRDGGRSWGWVCPEAMGYGGWQPRAFRWRADGSLWAATGNALLSSRDGACSWQPHPAFADTWVSDVVWHPALPARVWATTALPGGENGVWRSEDGGDTFAPTTLVRPGLTFSSVVLAPGEAARVYVAAEEEPPGEGLRVWASEDGGDTWRESVLPEVAGGARLTLLAVGPVDADVLFARRDVGGSSTLLRSRDGGRTFQEVLVLEDWVVGVELSADGQTVWVPTYTGMHRSQDGGDTYTRLTLPEGNGCARREGEVLLGCGSPWVHGWALAQSVDEGGTWEPLLTFQDLQAPLSCPADSAVARLCPAVYPDLARMLGIRPRTTPDAGVPPDAGGEGGDAGEAPRPGTPEVPTGCGCTAGGGALAACAMLLLVRLLASRPGRG